MCPPQALPQHNCLSWHHSAYQPESTEVARSLDTPPEVFWCISLYGVLKISAQPQCVRQTNTCVLLAKNPSSCVLSHACFSRTSSLLCLLQPNIPSQVCLSLSHLCPLQLNVPSRVCPNKTPSSRLSKELLSGYLQLHLMSSVDQAWSASSSLHCRETAT